MTLDPSSPVHREGPDDGDQQDPVASGGQCAAVEEEGQVGADNRHKALAEVPVPGVRAVECGQTVQHVEPQEVVLHQGPLEQENQR